MHDERQNEFSTAETLEVYKNLKRSEFCMNVKGPMVQSFGPEVSHFVKLR